MADKLWYLRKKFIYRQQNVSLSFTVLHLFTQQPIIQYREIPRRMLSAVQTDKASLRLPARDGLFLQVMPGGA